MKTLRPVDTATYEKIGAAYVVCAQYPEIFGDVPLKKFCGMFVDVLDEDEERMKAMAPAMYRVMKKIQSCNYLSFDLEVELSEVLEAIESGGAGNE